MEHILVWLQVTDEGKDIKGKTERKRCPMLAHRVERPEGI